MLTRRLWPSTHTYNWSWLCLCLTLLHQTRLQAALDLQLKYASGSPQLAQLQPQVEEQQRQLSRWEGRLGGQLEAIVSIQKAALSARSSGSLQTGGSLASSSFGENRRFGGTGTQLSTPQSGNSVGLAIHSSF